MKLLLHLSEMERWPRAVGNAKNALSDCARSGQALAVIIVANGEAVRLAAFARTPEEAASVSEADERERGAAGGAALWADLAELKKAGLELAFCQNALRVQGLLEAALPAFVTVVSAGVTEIARRQGEGYAYIRV